MSISFYDEAIVNKITNWVKNTNVQILKPDETTRFFEITSDQNFDRPIQLPLISISRDRDITILNTQKQVKTFDGIALKSNNEISMPINVIPIEIGYQIDIFTRHMVEADAFIREFVFNFINYPKLKVNIPYNDANLVHESNLWIDSSITDNSDISEKLFSDQFVRFTIKLTVDDAYLFSLPYKENTKLELVEFNVQDRHSQEIVESNVIFDINEEN